MLGAVLALAVELPWMVIDGMPSNAANTFCDWAV